MRPSLEAALSIAVRPSVRLSVRPVPTIHSKSERHRKFKFGEDMTLETNNKDNRFED